jgi:large subunit ribosomal protein L18
MRPIHKPRTRGERRYQRHVRVRKKVMGSVERPRLAVYRSLKHIYAQIIDDASGRTLAAASDLTIESGTKGERAAEVGKLLAQRSKEAGITQVVFDRAGFRYHGRVKAVAEAAREGGLEF